MWLLLITSLCKVWDFSSDASELNSWNLSKPLGYGLSDGLSEYLAWSSVTLRCVPLLIHGHPWGCFCLGTSWSLLGKGFLILIQDLHFPLGRELESILGAAFDMVDYSHLLETPSSPGSYAGCLPLPAHWILQTLKSLAEPSSPSTLHSFPSWLHQPPCFRYHLHAYDSHILTSSLDLL